MCLAPASSWVQGSVASALSDDEVERFAAMLRRLDRLAEAAAEGAYKPRPRRCRGCCFVPETEFALVYGCRTILR